GNTVTFTTPFHIGFATADQAQLSRFSDDDDGPVVPSVRSAGVEDLYLSGGRGGQGNIQVENCAYCWVKNIESDFQDGAAVSLDGTFRSVLRDSYIHSTQTPNPGGGGYGISFTFGSADNLVENNISWNMNKVMFMRASGVGNVIGYSGMSNPPLRSSETANLLGFEYEQTNFTDGMIPMWELGYNPPNFDLPPDPRVTSTVIRDGNFDFFTNTVKWDRPERAIPNSLYLTSTPPFFSGYTWPWFDPLGTTKTYRLPARDRFDAIQGLPQGGAD